MSNFAIDVLKSNVDSRVIIAMPDNVAVVGFTRGPFAINAGNEWNTPSQGAGQQNLTNLVNGIKGFLNLWFEEKAIQERIQHPGQTIKSWTGSNRPVFEVPLMFVRVRLTDDVESETLKLYKGVFGTSVSGGPLSRYRAPLNYAPTFSGTVAASGTVSLAIGRWFLAHGLVINTVNFNFADAPTAGGKPLWAEGSVSLEPFRAITYGEFRNYFRTIGAGGSGIEGSF